MLKVGDRVELYKIDKETDNYSDYVGKFFTIKNIESDFAELVETDDICPYLENLRLTSKCTGIDLLEMIKVGRIKNISIKVYKNGIYKFTIQCGEKAILDNPEHHIGMLTSDKYTYEPIIKKEMTISEIEKELGYLIKIVKED